MKPDADPPVHLTYCANVHPGESWEEALAGLERHVPAIKARVAPDRPFGVGMRLAAKAAGELAEPERLEAFKAFLAANDLYVFTVNAFPYGSFHGTRVKENVYLPDWRDEARLAYTDRVASILAGLLPPGLEGSVSTVPGAFRTPAPDAAGIARMAENYARHAAQLALVEQRSGKLVRLAIEPEPCCFLETVDETIRFFEEHLFAPAAAREAARLAGLSEGEGEDLLRRHLGVCFDVCHAAVEFEDEDALERIADAGIAVPKIQLSSALRMPRVNARARDLLRPFDDGVYLHQVVERGPDGGLTRFTDLDEAFATLADEREREWRVHFHVPVFRDDIGDFATTQDYLKAVLARHRRRPVSPHLEVETYTWGVLPQAWRRDDLAADIAREIEWVKRHLGA